ncbi:hypothetical protein PV325_000378 [Microctonus aethiopoides]|nr:hypothetical protein PV325_000378 [Microctonus aethiopoides]KAK0081990.1 hypothetical protein PV326_007396 [Microctonus aethiopoides]
MEKLFNIKKERYNPKPDLIARSRISSVNSSASLLVDTVDTCAIDTVNINNKNDDEGFTSPKKIGRIQKPKSPNNLNTNNLFQPLNTQSQQDADASTSRSLTQTPSIALNGATNSTRNKGKKIPPPIHTMGSSLKTIIKNKKQFVIWDGNLISKKIYTIQEGLQQGTVTSPNLPQSSHGAGSKNHLLYDINEANTDVYSSNLVKHGSYSYGENEKIRKILHQDMLK